MALIERSRNGSEDLEIIYKNVIKTITDRFLKRTSSCLIFLGAGVSIGSTQSRLPTGRELAKIMADECEIDWHEEISLSRIALYFEALRTREGLNDFLTKNLSVYDRGDGGEVKLPESIRHLVDIIEILEEEGKDTLVVTTNYDQLLELAYKEKMSKDLEVVIYNGGRDFNKSQGGLHMGMKSDEKPAVWRPDCLTCLFKMHGCISQADGNNLVITEEDYINFISNSMSEDDRRRLPLHVRAHIKKSTIVFIGYSLEDWNFRVMFKATAEQTHNDRFAIQLFESDPDSQERATRDAIVSFWEQKNVKIINAKADLFLADFLSSLREKTQKVGV